MKLVSSYDRATDDEQQAMMSENALRNLYQISKQEIENIASEFVGIEGVLLDAIKDDEDADYLVNAFLPTRLLMLRPAFSRMQRARKELEEMDLDV